MNKPASVRLPTKLLAEVGQMARREGKNKGTMIRELLEDSVRVRRERDVFNDYRAGKLSESEVCRALGIGRWDLLTLLAERRIDRNVSLEDSLNAKSLI